MLIPNTKVRFRSAFFSGFLAATAYSVLQWVFVTGQMYVAKYNAIYGSFSFIPLLLIWLQLVWLFTLIGAEICFASQNFSRFDYHDQAADMSIRYRLRLTIAVAAVIAQRFENNRKPLTATELSEEYGLPLGIVEQCYTVLLRDGVIIAVAGEDGKPDGTVVPAHGISKMTVGELLTTLICHGDSGFVVGFDEHFPALQRIMEAVTTAMTEEGKRTLLTEVAGQ